MTAYMKKKWVRSLLILVGVVVVFALWILLSGGGENYSAKYEGVDLTVDVTGIGRENTYAQYLSRYASAQMPGEGVSVDVLSAQKFLGHANVKVTLEIYSHLSKEKEDASAGAVMDAFKKRLPESCQSETTK